MALATRLPVALAHSCLAAQQRGTFSTGAPAACLGGLARGDGVPASSRLRRSISPRRAGVRVTAEEGRSSAEVLSQEEAQGAKEPATAAPGAPAAAGFLAYNHVLVPVMDRNPHLNEATRQALTFVTSMAKTNSALKITVVVIDEDEKEDSTDHQQRLDSIRFYLSEGGFAEFGLLERLGEGKMPAAVVGEVADDLALDLVVLPMEAVHHKHIDCNLLVEFTPCPVMLLPL